MNAKLIKGKHSGEYLLNMEGIGYITTYESSLPYKLSLKNCQAIERGYDLDELAEEYRNKGDFSSLHYFKAGFQKALELIGDKKFSEDDVINIAEYVRVASQSSPSVRTKYLLAEYQSLQQTEWEVKIEMVPALSNNGNVYYGDIPKLDENGCLILKLKSE